MTNNSKSLSILVISLFVVSLLPVNAQDKITWLDDFTSEMQIGSETYQYNFTHVESNDCKLKFEEVLIDKKGKTETRFWVFYLSDIDPAAIKFKAKGKSIKIYMKTRQSQKFISYYEGEELDEYTEEIEITMNEVDMTRSFIEAIKERIASCKETEATWETRDQAFTWLVNNIGPATEDKTEWDQKFEQGSRSFLVNFLTNSVNEKNEQESFSYTFDLTDINPMAINLKISGKSLWVEVPVKESKRFIKVTAPTGILFAKELLIYENSMELARQIVHALTYLVTNTVPEATEWDSYGASLEFVKGHLGEVKVNNDLFTNSINYDSSPSGNLFFSEVKSESDGTSESAEYAFYLTDIEDKLSLEVSKSSITIKMVTKNNRDFIRKFKDDKVLDYSSTLSFHVSDIDLARDILSAFEYAILNSEENVEEFSSMSDIDSWLSQHIGMIEIDGTAYAQNLTISRENENQMILEKTMTKTDGENTETRYILYPEDIGLDDLDIKVNGKKLSVLLQTENGKYVKKYENGELQNFTSNTEVLFSDPLAAKNFIAAVRFLKENSVVEERSSMNKEKAMAFLSGNIQNIEIQKKQYEQKLEFNDEGGCEMSFYRKETDAKGGSTEYLYEFTSSDIQSGDSKFSIKGALITLSLGTHGNEKLIKPYKNGEAGDFVDDFIIYVDDVLLAKRTLAAFIALSEECK